ncbi:unnamed protein product [Rotaria socialis]
MFLFFNSYFFTAQFEEIHFKYINSICWLKGTYYLPTDDTTIPDRSTPRINRINDIGWKTLVNIFQDGESHFESSQFPRVTMCDFMIRELGSNNHWYASQCNLPINLYNEAIFLGIRLWLIILTILNVFWIVLLWLFSLSICNRKNSMKNYLQLYQNYESTTSMRQSKRIELEKGFIEYINLDGFLVLRLIGHNTDEFVLIEIIGYLYQNYLGISDQSEQSNV